MRPSAQRFSSTKRTLCRVRPKASDGTSGAVALCIKSVELNRRRYGDCIWRMVVCRGYFGDAISWIGMDAAETQANLMV
jgi:hypothetical protein